MIATSSLLFFPPQVAHHDVVPVAKIVKMVMENSCRLSVVTPVKVKVGSSWGTLRDMERI